MNQMKIIRVSIIASAAVLLGSLKGLAQGGTDWPGPKASEIAGMIDERVEQLDQFQELLLHPDPQRVLAATEVLLSSGDLTLVRMALEFGLLSPDPAVRAVALRAALSSQSELIVRVARPDDVSSEVAESVGLSNDGLFAIELETELLDGVCVDLDAGKSECGDGDALALNGDVLQVRFNGLTGTLRWSAEDALFVGDLNTEPDGSQIAVEMSVF